MYYTVLIVLFRKGWITSEKKFLFAGYWTILDLTTHLKVLSSEMDPAEIRLIR